MAGRHRDGSIVEGFAAAEEMVRWVPVGEGLSAPTVLAREAQGEWIQWLRPGESLSPGKITNQLQEAGEPSMWDLLCSPYRLRNWGMVPILDPHLDMVSYVARLGAAFPFAAPLLWSTSSLRRLLGRRRDISFVGEDLLRWLRPRPKIGIGRESGSVCPGEANEPTREGWSLTLAWSLVLLLAERDPQGSLQAERLFPLLRAMDSLLAGRVAAGMGARNLSAKIFPRGRLAEAVMRRLREAEKAMRRGRQSLLRKMGLRRNRPLSAGRVEADEGAYASWIEAYERLDGADREAIRGEIGRFPRRPLLSVVMPVFNTPEQWLQRAIDSVRQQLYPDWELCLADDGSTAAHIRRLLETNRQRDPRIRVVFRAERGGIAAASNSALELARGEWIVLLDHDDELAEDALYMVVREILRDPEARLFYSDEDKIDEAGRRFHPYCKPDFSYDLLLSQNCINHLGVYRADLLRSLGGFRCGFDGSQDYDLALRFVEKLEPSQIRHIPRILYHWRAIASSGAACVEAKPYAYEAARRAITDHLRRIGGSAEVLHTRIPWGHRVRWKVPANLRASLLLGAGGNEERLRRSVESIRNRTEGQGYELLVIGGGGREKVEGVRALAPPTELVGPRLWSWAARRAEGEVLVFLESPVEVEGSCWLGELVSQAMRPGVGAVGARILATDGTVSEAGIVLGIDGCAGAAFRGWSAESIGYFGQAILVRNPPAVSAACLATRRALFEECGGFDEGYRLRLWDIDYCLRVREKGHRIVFTPDAELVREEAMGEVPTEDRERFRAKWARAIESNPGYNPNLGLECGGYGLAWPPRSRRPWRG